METTEKVKNAANNAKQKVNEKMNTGAVKSFVDQVQDVSTQVQDQMSEYADKATDRTLSLIKSYPVRSTLIALGVGFAIGGLFAIGRRSK